MGNYSTSFDPWVNTGLQWEQPRYYTYGNYIPAGKTSNISGQYFSDYLALQSYFTTGIWPSRILKVLNKNIRVL